MGNLMARLVRKNFYMHGVVRIGKRVNAEVRNYNLRNLDKETNIKVLNLIMSGWQLAPLRKEQVSSWLSSLLVIGMCIAS